MYVAPLGVHSLSSEIFMTSIILGLSRGSMHYLLATVIFSTLNSESHFMAAFTIGAAVFLGIIVLCHLQAAA